MWRQSAARSIFRHSDSERDGIVVRAGAAADARPLDTRGRDVVLLEVERCDVTLPALQRQGDAIMVAVRDVGAYGFSMSSTYNMRPRAAEALVDDGQLRLIRKRETFDDLVRNEIVE